MSSPAPVKAPHGEAGFGAGTGTAARIGLVLGPLLCIAILAAPPPDGLSPNAWHTAAVGALMAIWWITEALPIPATALLPLVLLPALGIANINAAAAPYANPVIFLFLGGFLIAAALQRCGLHRRMALHIIGFVGTAPRRLVGGFMLATAFISMWVSNTATVVMLLPMAASVLELAEQSGRERDPNLGIALMLGLAYGASIGGVGTLIGTPPNALLAGFMDEAYQVRIGFGQWMLIGVPLVAIALPITWLLLVRVLYPISGGSEAEGREMVRSELEKLGPPSREEYMVGGITALTAAAWIFSPLLDDIIPGISDAGIAIAGAALLFTIPAGWRGERKVLLNWSDAQRLPWGVLVLFGGGLSLASAIESTGLARWIGEALSGASAWPTIVLIGTVTAVVVFLTEITSNTATAAAFLPVAASLAIGVGHHPLVLTVPVAIAASCAFMMPVATPPNAIVYGTGRLSISQMVRAGFFLNLVLIALITVLAVTLVPRVLGS